MPHRRPPSWPGSTSRAFNATTRIRGQATMREDFRPRSTFLGAQADGTDTALAVVDIVPYPAAYRVTLPAGRTVPRRRAWKGRRIGALAHPFLAADIYAAGGKEFAAAMDEDTGRFSALRYWLTGLSVKNPSNSNGSNPRHLEATATVPVPEDNELRQGCRCPLYGGHGAPSQSKEKRTCAPALVCMSTVVAVALMNQSRMRRRSIWRWARH